MKLQREHAARDAAADDETIDDAPPLSDYATIDEELALLDAEEVAAREADPFPVATLLRAAVERARVGGRSEADVARAAGLTPSALSRALKPGSDARPSTVRAVLRVAGARLVLEAEVTPSVT